MLLWHCILQSTKHQSPQGVLSVHGHTHAHTATPTHITTTAEREPRVKNRRSSLQHDDLPVLINHCVENSFIIAFVIPPRLFVRAISIFFKLQCVENKLWT